MWLDSYTTAGSQERERMHEAARVMIRDTTGTFLMTIDIYRPSTAGSLRVELVRFSSLIDM